ncbi:MAG: ABC transporter permease [Acidobacteria bacterium]|nr:ABC transporter permease [Acidobacteriota bacterium]MBI3658126.1 ABC transporter permease [Acidobacteriota bacterium]
MNNVKDVGDSVLGFITEALKALVFDVQAFSQLSWRACLNVFSRPLYMRDILFHMDRIGVSSVFIIVLTGFFTGAVLGIQSENALRRYGAVSLTGQLVALTLVRELGPVLTALMVAGRIGSGIAAELGSMVVTEQISALRALGTDPIRKLVTPRMVATVTMLPLLTIICNFMGILGGWMVAAYKLNISSRQYWADVINTLEFSDVFGSLAKPLVFGFIISMVACYVGLRTEGGTEGVGRSTTQSVVSSSILSLAADFFLNTLLIHLGGSLNL